MKHVAVYCGSATDVKPELIQAVHELGALLARAEIGVVYGGAAFGMMGELADAVLACDGEVIGVIPDLFDAKLAHQGLSQLHVTASMHERKQLMFDLADGFIGLPGGLGTLEELIEVVTWARLGLHEKPIGLLNLAHYYDRLLAFLDDMQAFGFCGETDRQLMLVSEDAEGLLNQMASYQAPCFDRWWVRR